MYVCRYVCMYIYIYVCIYIYDNYMYIDLFLYPQVYSTHISCARCFVYEFKHGKSHMSLPVPVHTLKFFLYKHKTHKNIHITSHIHVYMNPCCANLHFCLCPCERSHFEPLCIHAYTYTFTYVWWTLLCRNPRCGNSHMSVPLRAAQLEPLCWCANTHKYDFFSDHSAFCIQTHCVQIHICLCPRKCSHVEPLCIHAYIYIYIHISCDGHICTRTYGAETHIWLCPCARSQLEPLCLHANAHKYTFFKS